MKMMYFFSMTLTVISNVIYHFCQKEIKADANPLVSLLFTYLSGIVLTLICLPIFYPGVNPIAASKNLNWASFGLGLGIVGLELGFLLAYRAGWNLSLGALVSNVSVTLVLIPIGLLFYNETINARQLLGIALSISGILLLGKK
jgi:drug/metabolite transporter (DMT)-like permease